MSHDPSKTNCVKIRPQLTELWLFKGTVNNFFMLTKQSHFNFDIYTWPKSANESPHEKIYVLYKNIFNYLYHVNVPRFTWTHWLTAVSV